MKKLLNALEFQLQDFQPDDDWEKHWLNFIGGKLVFIEEERKPIPHMVFITFVNLKKFHWVRINEKADWEIPIKFKNTPMMLVYEKFGFNIRIRSNLNEDEKIAKDAVRKINKSIFIVEKLIKPEIMDLINKGKIVLLNEYRMLRGRYEYFRQQANDLYLKIYKNKNERQLKSDLSVFLDLFASSKDVFEKQSNCVVAMIDSYFSLLEHILVLLKPFLYSPEVESDLSEFISKDWGDKFKAIFSVSLGGKDKQHYDELVEIKENYRNPLAHGHFQKGTKSLYVIIPNLGPIPVSLSAHKLFLSFRKIKETDFNDICRVFDCFDDFLDKGMAKYGMDFIKSGLDVSFDEETKQQYKLAMNSREDFSRLIDYLVYMSDKARNME